MTALLGCTKEFTFLPIAQDLVLTRSVVFDSESPWTVAHQAPLPREFSMQEHWNGVPFPTPGDFPDRGIEPASLASPALAGGFLNTSTT